MSLNNIIYNKSYLAVILSTLVQIGSIFRYPILDPFRNIKKRGRTVGKVILEKKEMLKAAFDVIGAIILQALLRSPEPEREVMRLSECEGLSARTFGPLSPEGRGLG
ncbi:hypothetical protein [Kluyvera sp. 142486]|uniref:hypothetical protein n=1 Tax=Kluyvera sp. 142486 TaxID=3390050 RepID=UPI00397F9DE7